MTRVPSAFYPFTKPLAALLLVLALGISAPRGLRAQDEEPIAVIGHGAFFADNGEQIIPTFQFVEGAQSWYRQRLLDALVSNEKIEFAEFERRLERAFDVQGQTRLVIRQRALEWLIERVPRTVENGRMRSKVLALGYRLRWRLARSEDISELYALEPFALDPSVIEKLRRPEFQTGSGIQRLVTTNSGRDYVDECRRNDVPIPPPIGDLAPMRTPGWRSLGFIPQMQQFIVGTPAEMRVFSNLEGMCIALPRYTDASLGEVELDGVICLSRTRSKACFWDNQMRGTSFTFPSGTRIPIGVPDLTVNPAGQYQAGGAEIEFGMGGRCTDCHAGENPYIIHPDTELLTRNPDGAMVGSGTRMGELNRPPLNLPTFSANRYDPIAPPSWPQNRLSHADALVPSMCSGCHSRTGTGGRLPHLSSDIIGYCREVLSPAVDGVNLRTRRVVRETMPQGSPGRANGDPVVDVFQNWCGSPAAAGPSNRGDPHLTTANGINYDFQAAGEFVSLRNSSIGFELQTRQTPVLTSFTPGANPYTGLASCVSLNTAAALRVGRHRITYQPARGQRARPEQMQLRIDGRPVQLTARGLRLGTRDRITPVASSDGIDVRLEDGTRVIITPNYWASEGYWYLNVEVLNSPAREGTMGTILGGNWLPLAPNGTSFGPMPAAMADRHSLLNRRFANAWRVTSATSLFDYAPGESTATFTDRGWPPPPGGTCTAIRGNPWPGGQPRRPRQPMDPKEAQRLCRPIEDRAAYANCVFDLTATGEATMVDAYRRTLLARTTP